MISEFMDTIHNFKELREFSVVLKHKEADFIEQLNFIHPRNIYHLESFEKAPEILVEHLEWHEGFVTQLSLNTTNFK